MKQLFPKICPACNEPLIIDVGDKSDTFKLMCKNKNCEGSLLKKLQKGIIALEIRGLGPKVIEKLLKAGIESSIDLFNSEKFNENVLISSGEFKKGRALQKIMDSVKNTKSLSISKIILSLQLEDVGKSFSERIGMNLSGIETSYDGLQYSVREKLADENSELNVIIKQALETFKKFGVKIEYFEVKKKEVATKKVTKMVAVENDECKYFVENLGWKVVDITDPDCSMFVGDSSDKANELGIKCMSMKKVKLLFG